VNKYGQQAINYIQDLDKYYSDIESTLQTTLKDKQAEEKENPTALSRMLEIGEAESVLWISDNHCNTETAAIAADVAKSIHASWVMDTGDQTMGGTEAERLCVAILPQRLGKEVPIVVSLGNHDARDVTARMDKDLGYVVLEGKPAKVKGYTIAGDSDVMRSEFNIPYRQIGPESVAEEGERIAEVACASEDVDIVMTHEPEAALPSAEKACAPLEVSGHTHRFKGPVAHVTLDGRVAYQMVNGTTGGAAPDKMTFESKLGQDATMVQLVFDKRTKAPLGYRTIVMHPDKTVGVGDLTAFVPPELPEKKVDPSASPSTSASPKN
jgi:predicted phosphodiesterase